MAKITIEFADDRENPLTGEATFEVLANGVLIVNGYDRRTHYAPHAWFSVTEHLAEESEEKDPSKTRTPYHATVSDWKLA